VPQASSPKSDLLSEGACTRARVLGFAVFGALLLGGLVRSGFMFGPLGCVRQIPLELEERR
jgi:hypothetical protein